MARTEIYTEQSVSFWFYEAFNAYVGLTEAITFTEGSNYIVVWDGTEYESTATTASFNGSDGLGIGNLAIAGVGEDTGEPFVMGTPYGATETTLLTTATDETHTIAVYLVEEDAPTVTDTLVLLDNQGIEQHFTGVKGLKVLTTGGAEQTFIAGEAVEKTVNLDFSGGDMEVIPEDGTLYKKVTVPQPLTLVPENIAKDVNVAGVIGTLSGGSGGEHSKSKPIRFFDVYGDVICSFTRAEIRKMTELPEGPKIDGLTFDKWNYTLEQLQSELYFADVGPFYKKGSDPATLIVIHTTEANRNVTLSFNYVRKGSGTGYVNVDWADGSTISQLSTTSDLLKSSPSTLNHTYSLAGTYIAIVTTKSAYVQLGDNYERSFATSICGARFQDTGTRANLVTGMYKPDVCSFIRSISARHFVDNLGFCNALRFVCGEMDFPRNTTNCGMVAGCGALQGLSIHGSIAIVEGWTPTEYRNKSPLNFSNWEGTTISRLTTSATNFITGNIGNPSLKEVYVDITGSSINPTMMNVEVSLLFNKTTPPTINTTPEWGTKPIYVPDEAIELYKAADKWSTVADYIYPASAYPDY